MGVGVLVGADGCGVGVVQLAKASATIRPLTRRARARAIVGRRAPCCASNMPGNLPSRCPIRTGASESVDEGAPQRRRGG